MDIVYKFSSSLMAMIFILNSLSLSLSLCDVTYSVPCKFCTSVSNPSIVSYVASSSDCDSYKLLNTTSGKSFLLDTSSSTSISIFQFQVERSLVLQEDQQIPHPSCLRSRWICLVFSSEYLTVCELFFSRSSLPLSLSPNHYLTTSNVISSSKYSTVPFLSILNSTLYSLLISKFVRFSLK